VIEVGTRAWEYHVDQIARIFADDEEHVDHLVEVWRRMSVGARDDQMTQEAWNAVVRAACAGSTS
jgi:hypothetical protein